MVTKDVCTEIERLGKRLTIGEVGDRLGLSKSKVYELIKQFQIPYQKKNPTQVFRRRLTRKLFEARVKRNYSKKSEAKGADTWVRHQESGILLSVMKAGKLIDTEFAHQWWKEKIDKVWNRRHKFFLGHTEVE